MLAEMIDRLKSLSDQAQEVQIRRLDPRNVIISQTGEYEIHQPAPPWRLHEVCSIDALCEATVNLQVTGENGSVPTVWHDEKGITGYIGPQGHPYGEWVAMELRRSRPLSKLIELENGHVHWTQGSLIRLLRTMLTKFEPEDFLSKIRTINFHKAVRGTSDQQHGSDSLGRDVERQVTGAGDIPELVKFFIPYFDHPGIDCQVCIQCAVTIDLEDQTIDLVPLPQELEIAKYLVQDRLHERLVEELSDHPEICVYHGSVAIE